MTTFKSRNKIESKLNNNLSFEKKVEKVTRLSNKFFDKKVSNPVNIGNLLGKISL